MNSNSIDMNDPEISQYLSTIQNGPQISMVVAEARLSQVNPAANFDPAPETPVSAPQGPALDLEPKV